MDFSQVRYINFKVFLLLLVILLLAYANSFKGVWVLDDGVNIVKNEMLHIETLTFANLKHAAFTSGQDFPRPFAMLTLALNWYFGGDNVLGYHIVNFAIHLLSAFFLFLTIKALFHTPVGRNLVTSQNRVYIIAFFAALLWALHPIQVQAVTYIVQRMASMSAMFCIMALYCFLRGKASVTMRAKTIAYILCLACFVFGLATKENAAILPCILILTYLVFLREKGFSKNQKILLSALIGLTIVVIVTMAVWQYEHIVELYDIRFFTPGQRLLTETRVLFFYLSQIFWPIPSRFSIEHYMPLSTSLVSPITTLFSCVGIIILIALALVKMRRWPLVSYAILFYFGGHVIESSIMPLELVFEHRNYLPSMFIGVPLIYGFFRLRDYLKRKQQMLAAMITAIGMIVVLLVGFSTYLRNYMWMNELVLYEAALERYPQSTRAHLIIALYYYYYGMPETDILAVEHFEKAFENNHFNNYTELSQAISILSKLYVALGDKNKAIDFIEKYAALYGHILFKINLQEIYLDTQQWEKALPVSEQLLKELPYNLEQYVIVGNNYWKTGNYKAAEDIYAKINDYMNSNDEKYYGNFDTIWSNLGFGYTAMGLYTQAEANYTQLFNSTAGNKTAAAWFLLGLAKLQNKPLPQEQLTFLENLPLKTTLDTLEVLYTTDFAPADLKVVWRQIFEEYFKTKMLELEQGT